MRLFYTAVNAKRESFSCTASTRPTSATAKRALGDGPSGAPERPRGWCPAGRTPGITSRPSRHAALLALAARLPAPILAERLGFHPARAAQWVRAAGATYADYVALRQEP